MPKLAFHLRGALVLAGSVWGGILAPAAFADAWSVSAPLQGKTAKDGSVKAAEDVSGMACAPAQNEKRLCLLVDDETQGAQIVVVTGNRLLPGAFISLISDKFGEKPLELDAEAAAFGHDAFFVIGSHGRPRNESASDEERNVARAKASSHLFRLSFEVGSVDLDTGTISKAPVITESAPLAEFMDDEPTLRQKFGKPLEDNGTTIEGFAIRGTHALIGFRGPIDGEAALLLEIPLSALFGSEAKKSRVIRLCLGRDARGGYRGVRDLVSSSSTIYGIAGPVNDPPKDAPETADYAFFRVTSSGESEIRSFSDKSLKLKPEALVSLDSDEQNFGGLVLFDGAANGAPRSLNINFGKPEESGEVVSASCPGPT